VKQFSPVVTAFLASAVVTGTLAGAVALFAPSRHAVSVAAQGEITNGTMRVIPNDNTVTVGDTTYPSRTAFIATGRRCGTPTPTAATLQAVQQKLQQSTSLRGTLAVVKGPRAPGSVTIPVYVHIITSAAGAGNISDATVAAQIDVLNKDYAGLKIKSPRQPNSAQTTAKTAFRFQLMSIDRTANDAWFTVAMGSSAEVAMKNTLRKGGANALNLYFANIGNGLLGWATFPWEYGINLKRDGVVVLTGSVPGGPAAPFNLGATATHEVGHWLGLLHTFQDGCTSTNDNVIDTPAEAGPFFGPVPPNPDSCTGVRYPGRDPVENFMDYTDDAYMYQFTPNQSTRMDTLASQYRGL